MNTTNWKRYAQIIATCVLLPLSLAVPQAASDLTAAPAGQAAPVQTTASITLAPTGDTTVQEAHPATNYGDSNSLLLGRIDGGRARALIEFDIGEIPLGATINSATLLIYQGGWYDYSGSVRTVSADRVTLAWHEAVATWNYAPTIGTTVGSVNVGMSTGGYSIDVTDAVREWYTGAAPNYGLLLRGYEGSENVYRLFVPRLYVHQPQLIVDYTLQPATLDVSTHLTGFQTDGQKIRPSSSIVRVINRGIGAVSWSINKGSTAWLDIVPTSGSTSASYNTLVEVSVLTNTLSPGTYTAPFTITASGAQNSPQVVQVTVNYRATSFQEIYVPLVLRDSAGGSEGSSSESPMVALLVGIADYQYLQPPPSGATRTGDWGYDLEYTHQDPDHVRKPIMAFGSANADNTRLFVDAEAPLAGIQQAFAWADEQEGKTSGGPAKVFFSYSGHGGQGAGGTPLITAYDTNEVGGDFTNAISGATLGSWLDSLDSQQVFVAIDACRSGGLLPTLSQPGRVVLTSAASDQSAWEVSEFNGTVFTHYLVQALMDPSADTNGNGCISAEEAYAYSANRTDSYVQTFTVTHQIPQMYDGVPGQLCLSVLPSYGPMAAASLVAGEAGQPAGAVFFFAEPVALPKLATPLR